MKWQKKREAENNESHETEVQDNGGNFEWNECEREASRCVFLARRFIFMLL